MEKEITVMYRVGKQEDAVLIAYSINMSDDIQTISCTIRQVNFNTLHWLQLRKFELKSVLSSDGYMPLFTDQANIKNMDAVLFIEKAYSDIMASEKFKMALV